MACTKDDERLTQRIIDGDSAAFKIFFDRNYQDLLAYVTVYVRNQNWAKDIAQYAFIKIWEKRNRLNPEKSLKSYLFQIAKNRYLNEYRKKMRTEDLLDALKERAMTDILMGEKNDMDKKLEVLRKAVDNLPPKCRDILLLNKYDGLSYKEIAKHLNLSVKTIESQMRIAYKKIREEFNRVELFVFILLKNKLSRFLD